MSDSNLNQNTSEDRDARANGPEAAPAAQASARGGCRRPSRAARCWPWPAAASPGSPWAACWASWGVTSRSIASGRVEIRTTPTKMIVTDRARCSGCQRCEMMCTLKNDGRVSQHTARVRVWQNYNWGANPDGPDGVYKSCEFTVEHCKQCAEAACMEYCPVHAIYASEDNGARMVDADRCIGCGMCASACPWNMPRVDSESRVSTKCVSCGRCAEQCPNGAIKFIDWEDIAQKVIEQGVVRTTTLVQA